MATMRLPPDFKEFLQLLNSHGIEYLIVGGYAVAYHGHPRATGDIDVWIAMTPENARKVTEALRDFGFTGAPIPPEMFLKERQVIRMGLPPVKIELLTSISGVEFSACYARRSCAEIDGVKVDVIGLDDLRVNKKASGRLKDLSDLEMLQ